MNFSGSTITAFLWECRGSAVKMHPAFSWECRGNAAAFRCRGISAAFFKMPQECLGNAAGMLGMPQECSNVFEPK